MLTQLQGGQGEGLTGPQIWCQATSGRWPVSSLELHLHLGTAWSRFRPQAEWGAGWGWWRLLLLAGCSAVRREGGHGRGHHGVWGADRGASCAPCSEVDRSACRCVVTAPCRGDRWRGSWEEALLGGLGEGLLGHPSSPHVSSTPQPSMRCTSVLCCVLIPVVPPRAGAGVCRWTVDAESSLGACKQVKKLLSGSRSALWKRKLAVMSQELRVVGGSFGQAGSLGHL